MTVRHLLTHTSGIDGDVFTDTGRGDDCVERYVDVLAERPVGFTPGVAYSYCNSGYVLLGRIIEVGTGFVLRSRDDEPWVPVSFGELADGTPYIYLSGRVTPRVG